VPKRWWGGGEPLARWQVAVAGGARSVTVVQPDWVSMPCTRYIGLRTDYQPATPAPPERVQPYPKDGLAVSPPYAVDRIDILAAESPELRALAPAVRAAFNEAERTIEDRFGHPIARRSREGLAPDLEAVYAYGDNPRTYYVEATRTYRQLGQRAGDCTAVGSGTGWFARDADGIRSLTMVVDLLNCDRRSASYMLPLGVLRTDGHLYWLGQFSGWDHERYVVLELKKKSVDLVLNRWASGC
jgi:hypothetical protein